MRSTLKGAARRTRRNKVSRRRATTRAVESASAWASRIVVRSESGTGMIASSALSTSISELAGKLTGMQVAAKGRGLFQRVFSKEARK